MESCRIRVCKFQCRDPEIYCKFRSSCSIYFISKKGFKDAETESEKSRAEPVRKEYAVVFEPVGKRINVLEGTNLLDASQKADIYINALFFGNTSPKSVKYFGGYMKDAFYLVQSPLPKFTLSRHG